MFLRHIDFTLNATGWNSSAIDALSLIPTDVYAFSSFKLDYGICFLRPLEMRVPPVTQPLQPHPYRLNSVFFVFFVFFEQVNAILGCYITFGLIHNSTSP